MYQANTECYTGHSAIKRHLVSALFLITSKQSASFKECEVNVVELNTNQPFSISTCIEAEIVLSSSSSDTDSGVYCKLSDVQERQLTEIQETFVLDPAF